MNDHQSPTDHTPRPECSTAIQRPDSKWHTFPVSDGMLAFDDPCTYCVPDGEIGVDIVVRSNHKGPVLHSPEQTAEIVGVDDR